MSETLLAWLNKDVVLSKKIDSIEEDFANGYLLGELLNKYKQITTFKEFLNKDDKESKIKNFGKLELALRNMDIKIDSRNSDEIINKKKGVVLRLLFSIKMVLEKKGINQENLLYRGCNIYFNKASKISNLHMSISYDTKKIRFEDKNNKKNKITEKQSSPKISINKYDQYKVDQEKLIDSNIISDYKEENKTRQTKHDILKSLASKQHLELIEIDSENLKNWEKCIERKIAFEKKQEKLEHKEAEQYQAWLQSVLKVSNQENQNKIDFFDKNLSRLGLDIKDDKLKKAANKAMMSSEMVIQKIKEKIAQNQNAKKERDRRRRKIAVDQIKAEAEIEKKKDNKSVVTSKSLHRNSSVNKMESSSKRVLSPEKVGKFEKIIEEKEIIELNTSPNKYLDDKELFLKGVQKLDYKRIAKEVAIKTKKRLIDTELCKYITDLIVDIAEDAYQYQVMRKSELIEAATWKEWTDIFVCNDTSNKNDDKINLNINLSNKSMDKSVQNAIGSNNNESFDLLSDGNNLQEESELVDYINFIGQWSVDIIPNTALMNINLNDILYDNLIQTQKSNKTNKKMRTESQQSYHREEDPYNLIIPKEPVKNPYFGDIIDMLIDLKFPEKYEKNFNLLHYIPIKLSLLGHSFGGKRAQAKMICDSYPFKQYNIEDLVNKSLEILERLETPIEANPKFKTMKKNQIDQLQDEKNKDEIKFAEIKKIASIIRDSRKINKDSNLDDVYINLLLAFIKFDFPEKTESQILDEVVQKHKRKKEIIEELNKIKEEALNKKAKPKVKEEQQLNQELSKINTESNKGIVIIDFPQTLNQAKLLENKLTNYIQEIEKPKQQVQIYRENLAMLVDRSQKPPISNELNNGGLDIILNLEVDSQICIKRSVLRRVDPNNGNLYHLEDNPPPNDNKVLDRLKPIEDAGASETVLKHKHVMFDNEITQLNDFYNPFGIQEHNFSLMHKVNGQKNKEQVFNSINEIISKYAKTIDEKETLIFENKHHNNEEMIIPNSSLNQHNLTSHYQSINLNLSIDQNKEINNVNGDQNNDILSSSHNFVMISLEDVKKKLSFEMRENLIKNFFKTYETYTNECKSVFKFFRKQNDLIINGYYNIQKRFLDFIRRKNQKQQVILEYTIKYNKFLDDYPDLKDDIQLREEHMHNIDNLGDKIWDIIDIRKTESIEERNKIISQGWIEKEMEKTFSSIITLFQCEMDKFLSFLLILREYYFSLENKPLVMIPNTIEIVKEELEAYPIENSDNENLFPRLEKLYKIALKLQFMWDDMNNKVEEKEITTDRESKNKRTLSVINHHGNKTAKDQLIIEKKESYKFEEDYKSILKNEKAKYRFRLTLIKHWVINRLKSFRRIATHTFEKLDNWIITSVKIENDALNQLTNLLKNEVDKDEKLKLDIDMDPFEAVVAMDGTSFIEFQNRMYNEKEPNEFNKFNIGQLRIIIQDIKAYEIQKNFVRTSSFVEIYLKKYFCSKTENEIFYAIPLMIRKLSSINIFKFIKNMENHNTEILNCKKLFTILLLINAEIISETQETELVSKASNFLTNTIKINKEKFMSLEFWFENDENISTLTNFENYNRIEYLKQSLFEVNQDDEGFMNFPYFVKIITLKELNMEKEKSKTRTYFDLLFF